LRGDGNEKSPDLPHTACNGVACVREHLHVTVWFPDDRYQTGNGRTLPPKPHLHLNRGHKGSYLVLSSSHITNDMRRLLGQGNPLQYEAKITPGLFSLLDTLKNPHPGIAGTHDDVQRLRAFHAKWHWHSIGRNISNEQIVKDVKMGINTRALHAFYFPDPRLRQLTRRIPAQPPPPPIGHDVAHWSDLQKVDAMFDIIKKDRTLSKDLGQDVQGLFTAQNIAIIGTFFTAGFFDGFDVVAAAVGELWIDWSLILACCRFGVAVIHASQATNQNEINQAAQKAASAMITFGMVGVLKEIADRGETPGGRGPAKDEAPKDHGEPHRHLKSAYREGKVTKENFTNFKPKKSRKSRIARLR